MTAPDLLNLDDVARELLIDRRRLVALSRRGKFPNVLRVTNQHLLVNRGDYEAWKAGRWTHNDATRAALVLEAVRGGVVNKRRKTPRGTAR